MDEVLSATQFWLLSHLIDRDLSVDLVPAGSELWAGDEFVAQVLDREPLV